MDLSGIATIGRVPPKYALFSKGSGQLSSESVAQLQDAEVLLADPGLISEHQLLYQLPKLKWMQSTWAGVDSVMRVIDKNKPLPTFTLTRFAGCFGPHMSEFVIAQIIAHERKFTYMNHLQSLKVWEQSKLKNYRLLSQLSIGIIGVGSIGKHVAETCRHFGMTVWGVVNRPVTDSNRCPHVQHYRSLAELDEVLASCDYLCNLLPSTPQTRHLLSGGALSKCVKKPVFINLGRGDVTDEQSIITALEQQWISHAILDVFEKEPLPPDSALWEQPEVTISPHVSAESFDWQVADVFLENYERYCNGQELLHQVEWNRGY